MARGSFVYDIKETCKSVRLKELISKNFSLKSSDYINFVNRDNNTDYDKEMKRIKNDFSNILKKEDEINKKLVDAFIKLGYEIKNKKLGEYIQQVEITNQKLSLSAVRGVSINKNLFLQKQI